MSGLVTIRCRHRGCGRWIVKARRIRTGIGTTLQPVGWRKERTFRYVDASGSVIVVEHRTEDISWVSGDVELDAGDAGTYWVEAIQVQCSQCGHWTQVTTRA